MHMFVIVLIHQDMVTANLLVDVLPWYSWRAPFLLSVQGLGSVPVGCAFFSFLPHILFCCSMLLSVSRPAAFSDMASFNINFIFIYIYFVCLLFVDYG